MEIGKHLILGDAANCGKLIIKTVVLDIVKLAEDAQLAELGDACEEYKAEIGFLSLQWAKEVAHDIADLLLQLRFVVAVQHGSIVFIYQHNSLMASFLYCILDDVLQSYAITASRLYINAKSILIIVKDIIENTFEVLYCIIFATAKIEMNDRVLHPVFLQLVNGKAFE